MIVLDTHIIIWDALKPDAISNRAKKAISKAKFEKEILICEISWWETAMLIKKGRLQIKMSYLEFIDLIIRSNPYIIKGITPEIANLSVNFPDSINFDPADRIIAATAILHDASLITADENLIAAKEIKTIW
ncbi:MAG TPA: type II toxin-antitoxin system VapC family toxin [Bacteroidales bacterium]|nr:type II toxin-antitoxin system VapC family toxin [Bacteroidales bacterium]HRX98055.1 type II toxin-antitoxin system VapC family toxin [Bacteroidales bacterium]